MDETFYYNLWVFLDVTASVNFSVNGITEEIQNVDENKDNLTNKCEKSHL